MKNRVVVQMENEIQVSWLASPCFFFFSFFQGVLSSFLVRSCWACCWPFTIISTPEFVWAAKLDRARGNSATIYRNTVGLQLSMQVVAWYCTLIAPQWKSLILIKFDCRNQWFLSGLWVLHIACMHAPYIHIWSRLIAI